MNNSSICNRFDKCIIANKVINDGGGGLAILYLVKSEISLLNIIKIFVLLSKYFEVEICEETMDQLSEGALASEMTVKVPKY